MPTKKVTTAKEETFSAILSRGNNAIKGARAKRFTAQAKMAFDAKVNKIVNDIFMVENKLEEMADISTSNSTTTKNAIGMTFDAESFVDTRARLKLDLVLLEQKLEVLKEDESFYV